MKLLRKPISCIVVIIFLITIIFSPLMPANNVHAAGGTLYEAESAVRVDAEVQTLGAGFSGTGYVDLGDKANASSMTWQSVYAAVSGNYILNIKYSNNSINDTPMSITVNGQKVTTFNGEPTDVNTWGTLTSVVALNMGNNTIKLVSESADGSFVDYLEVIPYATIVETESGGGAAHSKVTIAANVGTAPGFSGTGYVSISDLSGYMLFNNVVVPSTGKYTIKLRYSLGNTTRPAKMTVNGTQILNIKGLGTGAWSNWKYEELKGVDLNAGSNTIKIERLASNTTAVYDRFEIEPEAVPVLGDQTYRTTTFEATDIDPMIAATATDAIVNSPLLDGKKINSLSETSVKLVNRNSSRMAEITIPATKRGIIGFPFNNSWTVPVSMKSYTVESSFILPDKNANYLFKLIGATGFESTVFVFGMDGKIYARSNNTASGALAERGIWSKDIQYKIKLVFHVDTQSYEMYLDGNKIIDNEPMQTDTYTGGLKGFYMEAREGARLETKILVDDIQLSGSNALGTAAVVNPNLGKLYEDQPYIGTPVNYYISGSSGLDINDGKSTEKAFKTIQKAATVTNPGDTVFIMPGTYLANTSNDKWLNITRSGAHDYETGEAYYITYKAYDPTNKPKLQLVKDIKGIWNMVSIQANYIIFDGVEVEGTVNDLTLAMGEENYNLKIAGGTDWA
ncbi:MAG: hypothetical protein H7Y18_01170, partial [Clostridiaceae bacterium]|nr:hypothetical protein [Clostridiaceae bacterium]